MMMLFILIIIFIFTLLFYIIGDYFFNIALNPKISKKYILRSIGQEEQYEEYTNKEKGKVWLKTFSKEIDEVSNDNLKLHGYMVENPIKKSDIWVILAHGYMGDSYEMAKYAKKFIEMGYNALLVDLRAHGKSEGKYIGMGWLDRLDIINWIEMLRNENKDSKIILYGISMGAATMLMTSGENLPQNVKICIEDCSYTSVLEEFNYLFKNVRKCISKTIIFCSSIIAKIKAKYSFEDASVLEQTKKIKIPTLFIHGKDDTFVPYKMVKMLYKNVNSKKEILEIDKAGHTKSSKVNPDLYWNTIRIFIDENIDNYNIHT